jgi:signal peptidase I
MQQQEPTISQPNINEYPPAQSSDHEPNNSTRKERTKFRSIISTILILLSAPLVAFLLTAFVFQSYEVDGPSMQRTLFDGDRLIVIKTGKTWARLSSNPFIPKRGDIIVFTQPSHPATGRESSQQLIKRVIGLPGDRVIVSNGKITIYNNDNMNGYNPDQNAYYGKNIASSTPGNVDLVVPANEVFVSGDNRTNSRDSRDFGTIKTDDIVGSLAFRIYPFRQLKAY